MRESYKAWGMSCDEPCEEAAARRTRSGRVRLSWVSREVLFAAVAIGAVGVFFVMKEGDPDADAGRAITAAHGDLLESLVSAPDQELLISSGRDDTVRFWDLGGGPSSWGREIDRLPHGSHPFALALSPDRRFLAVGGRDDLAVWERRGEGWAVAFEKRGGEYRGLAFAPDSKTLALGSADGVVRVVEAPSMREIASLAGFPDRIHSVAFSPDGSILAAVDFNGKFRAWVWKSGRGLTSLEERIGPVHCFAFMADGRSLAAAPWGIASGGPSLWDLATGELKRRFAGQVDGVNRLVISPDGRFLATATMNQSIKVWDVDTGEIAAMLDKDLGWVKTVAFTQDGARIAYGGRDGTIRFWDFAEAAGAVPGLARTGNPPSSTPEALGAGLKSVKIAWSSPLGSVKPRPSSTSSHNAPPYSMFFLEDFAARTEKIGD